MRDPETIQEVWDWQRDADKESQIMDEIIDKLPVIGRWHKPKEILSWMVARSLGTDEVFVHNWRLSASGEFDWKKLYFRIRILRKSDFGGKPLNSYSKRRLKSVLETMKTEFGF